MPTESALLADVWAGLRREASAQGVPERGVQLVTRLRARLDAVAARAGQQPTRPRVACLVGPDPPAAPGGWLGELIGWAGGEPVRPGDGRGPGAAEPKSLGGADPDVLVFACATDDLAAAGEQARAVLGRPGWAALRAVREGRVFVAAVDPARPGPGPRVAETLEAFAEMLHPAAFRFGHEGVAWARVDAPDGTC